MADHRQAISVGFLLDICLFHILAILIVSDISPDACHDMPEETVSGDSTGSLHLFHGLPCRLCDGRSLDVLDCRMQVIVIDDLGYAAVADYEEVSAAC